MYVMYLYLKTVVTVRINHHLVQVLEGKTHYLEFAGNLTPVTKSGDQLTNKFLAFRENRLPFTVRVKDPNNDPLGQLQQLKKYCHFFP